MRIIDMSTIPYQSSAHNSIVIPSPYCAGNNCRMSRRTRRVRGSDLHNLPHPPTNRGSSEPTIYGDIHHRTTAHRAHFQPSQSSHRTHILSQTHTHTHTGQPHMHHALHYIVERPFSHIKYPHKHSHKHTHRLASVRRQPYSAHAPHINTTCGCPVCARCGRRKAISSHSFSRMRACVHQLYGKRICANRFHRMPPNASRTTAIRRTTTIDLAINCDLSVVHFNLPEGASACSACSVYLEALRTSAVFNPISPCRFG